ncbi:hypothetical protein PROFUN_09389 [Planoprotostelium fungivorum]|uniref:Proteasome subunit alpha type n=1 Tax=Planoprotostelium fungivorum TaxID=1890364 RepID=A0A2P6NHE8_9EUKA|nr:hypothetical protein PROFUN_09389 [Planoprotostelium fungivorum]
MFRSDYDSDISIWSPQGRIHQIEYAMEAVKQGSASVGLKSKTHAVVAAVKRASSELGSNQQKVFRIDDHLAISMSGLTADGRVLTKYLRNECLNHKFVYEQPMPVSKLVVQLADKSQVHTQQSGRRPYGVGLLVIGYDENGPHLYETSPSGNYYDYKAQAIGNRFQSARTYLEKTYETFDDATPEELIRHSLLALRETVQTSSSSSSSTPNEGITSKNAVVAIVGRDQKLTIYENEELIPFLAGIETSGAAAGENTATSMEE